MYGIELLVGERRLGENRLAAAICRTERASWPRRIRRIVRSEAGIALGHRRSSILDLSLDGQQSMMSEDGRFPR